MKNSTSPTANQSLATDSGPARSKLASVLALSSTALSGAFMANAQVIFSSGPLDVVVGFVGTELPSYTIDLPGSNDIVFLASFNGQTHKVLPLPRLGATYLKANANFVSGLYVVHRADPGQTFNGIGTASSLVLDHAQIAARKQVGASNSIVLGPGGFSHKYMSFEFKDTTVVGAPVRYGWIELSATVSSSSGPTVTIHDWAYEGTGLTLGMGVPEPADSTVAVAGALLLGAAGLRTWRKRKLSAGA
jgi:hypothetical protein